MNGPDFICSSKNEEPTIFNRIFVMIRDVAFDFDGMGVGLW